MPVTLTPMVMDRRAFLAGTGACLSGLAGCGSAGSPPETDDGTATGEPTVTATPTPPPTSTPTGAPAPTVTPPDRRYLPQLLDVGLVSTWAEPGDLTANRIRSIRRGQPAVVAFRYRLRVPEGTINLKEGVDVVHDGELVVRRFRDVDRHVDAAGLYTWEDAVTFETADWPTGELTATVAVGELQLHRTSESVSTTFDVTSA
jgi:hypothetical protein